MYQQGGTIKLALDKIVSNEYVLPAIQREFVWSPGSCGTSPVDQGGAGVVVALQGLYSTGAALKGGGDG